MLKEKLGLGNKERTYSSSLVYLISENYIYSISANVNLEEEAGLPCLKVVALLLI